MPDWLWVCAIFVALTVGYISGFSCGSLKSEAEINKCPSEAAYIREAEILADANVRIETRKAELVYQAAAEQWKAAAMNGGDGTQKTQKEGG